MGSCHSTLTERLNGLYKMGPSAEEILVERKPDFVPPIQIEAAEHIEFLINALEEIKEFGKKNPGKGYSCSKIAEKYLEKANYIRED